MGVLLSVERSATALPGHPRGVLNGGNEVVVRLGRKTYNPVFRQADLPVTQVPRRGGRTPGSEPA